MGANIQFFISLNYICIYTHEFYECIVNLFRCNFSNNIFIGILSCCVLLFQSLFTSTPCQHPIVILKDIKYNDLKTMVDFMYYGEVNVSQDQLPAILKVNGFYLFGRVVVHSVIDFGCFLAIYF